MHRKKREHRRPHSRAGNRSAAARHSNTEASRRHLCSAAAPCSPLPASQYLRQHPTTDSFCVRLT